VTRTGSFTSLVLIGLLNGGCMPLPLPLKGHHAPGPERAFDRDATEEAIAGTFQNLGEPPVRLSELFWPKAAPETHEAVEAIELSFPDPGQLRIRALPTGPDERIVRTRLRRGTLDLLVRGIRPSRLGLVRRDLRIGLDERGDLRCDLTRDTLFWFPIFEFSGTDRLRFERVRVAPESSGGADEASPDAWIPGPVAIGRSSGVIEESCR